MKSFNTQTVTKPSFTQSKAYGLCGTIALATALLIGAGAVSADETAQPVADTQPAAANVYTADNAGNVTVTPSETVAPVAETPVFTPPAPVESQPIVEAPATTTEVAQPVAETPAAPTSVVKEGDTITVNNPEVDVTFPNGNGKYSPFEVEYKDIEFPDSMPINEGDKVVTELPKEIGLQTSFDFDVYNNENIVGKANADAQARKITTTFNNYFTGHPLNKKMSLKFDAKWLDIVEPGKPVTVNFNGTVKTFEIADGNPIPTDELLSKWGWQDKNDPQIINWTLRLNTARKVLNNAILSDTWSNNQQFVDGSQNIYFVEDPLDWTVIDHSAKDYLESWNVRADGFDAKFKEFNRIMYIGYQTRLKTAVKDSTNPTNKATLTADSSTSNSSSKVQLVGGKGDASGENKPEPTFEIPREAPKVEIPEFEGGIPGIPEVRELPPFEGGVIPNDAPILDLPELHIPEEPTKPEKPSTPKEVPNKPVDAPKTKEVEITEVVYKNDSEPKEVANTTVYGGTLPLTGEKEGIMSTLGLVVIAAGIASLTLSFKKHNEGEE
ncbi:collagen binding domain-containing protein [Streptococcus salivarius]